MMNKDDFERAVTLRHELHRHPELACREKWTKRRLIDFLTLNTALEVVDRGRWFYAVYRAGADKPAIAFRADFDALPMDETIELPYGSQFPGVSHKCGHDGHSACLAAFALEIDREGADKTIYFVFQHAEETGEGAMECTPLLEEAGISEIFGYHNVPGLPEHLIGVKDGTICCASTGMIIWLKGIPCHASQPEAGRNPAFAVAEIIRSIPACTDPAGYTGLVMCTVICIDVGEEAFGMSASEGRLLLTIRGEYDDELETLKQKLTEKIKEQAEQYGLEYRVAWRDRFFATASHKTSNDKVRRAARELGLALGEGDKPALGSEDFGCFTRHTRGAFFWVGGGEGRPGIHTAEYDFNDAIIPTVVDMYTAIARM
ncbi:MAG: amidohydrolase [Spirochaetaceae bacterium]|jgi:amidohydrolase|nr:amidohydrolase [Spirochaetaceae bacterium]